MINQYALDHYTNRPGALRIILDLFLNKHVINLDQETRDRIDKLLSHSLIKNRYNFNDTSNFIEWAVKKAISRLSEERGTLMDVSVRTLLTYEKKEVAKNLLFMIEDINRYYNGITVSDLKSITKLNAEHIKSILNEFYENGWVSKSNVNDETFYFPLN